MTLAGAPIGGWPIAAQVTSATSTKKPPRNRQIIAKPDETTAPEPR